jgi:hypothetical protein
MSGRSPAPRIIPDDFYRPGKFAWSLGDGVFYGPFDAEDECRRDQERMLGTVHAAPKAKQ